MKLSLKHKLVIVVLFLTSLFFRTYGLNWDQGQHLHPDERFLTMVTADIKLPANLIEYFDTGKSPLNPYNYPQYQFFVYGTFPVFLTKLIAVTFHLDNYQQIVLVGRFISAIFDSLSVVLIYLIFIKINLGKYSWLPSLLYIFTVLPLQLSHFYAVDTFLTTFILLTFTLMIYNLMPLAALAFGLALACKISAIYFVPIIIIYLLTRPFKPLNYLLYIFITAVSFRIFQPYSFIGLLPNPQFLENIKTLQSLSQPNIGFPPAVQWIGKIRWLFPIQNIVLYGFGITLSFAFLFSISRFNLWRRQSILVISLVWIIWLIFIQGGQFASSIRYFLPIYPFLCFFSGFILVKHHKLATIITIFHLLCGVSFLTIYSRPHSRVEASSWINQNIPRSSTIATEYWDDALPLSNTQFLLQELHLFDQDSPQKWQILNSQLNNSNYYILSSNRLWGTIPFHPEYYPIASNFYHDLFDDKTNFKLINHFYSYPGLRLPFIKQCYLLGQTNYPGQDNHYFEVDNCQYPGVYFRDNLSEEAFTVYDHPEIFIFQKK